MNKINISYLKKNFNLKKFLKFIGKPSGIEENFEIYHDFIDACATREIKSDQLWNILDNQKKDIMWSLSDKFTDGKFFPFISKNFKVLDVLYVKELGEIDPSLKEFYSVQLISSKMDKRYYVASYHGKYTTIDDSYNIIKIFKNKQKAYDFLDVYIVKKSDEFAKSDR
tara:strand:+ start:49 stop:552 length:504 start_codon:yes stop_codon:yes gene_type:complete